MEWQPIETAPKDGSFIDSYNAYNGERRVTCWDEKWDGLNGQHWRGWDGHWGNNPTYWMPLPPPPNNGE